MSVALLGDINSFNKGMDKAGTKMQTFAAKVGAAGTKIANAGKAMALGITLPLIGFGVAAVKFAADAEEIQSKFDAVFKEFGEQTTVWINDFAEAVNRNATDLKEYASVFQDTFVPLGFARGEAAELSQSLVELTIDLASFNNASEPETMRALQSAIVGNHETVRKFGVIITQATLNIELMNMGIKDGVKAATEAEKAQARLNLIIRGTSDAQGDAARTAESFTNQMRGMKSDLKTIAEDFGAIIIEGIIPFTKKLKEILEAVKEMSPEQKEKIIKYLAAFALAGPIAIGVGTLAKGISALALASAALTGSAAGKALVAVFGSMSAAIAAAAVAALGAFGVFKAGEAITKGLAGGLDILGEKADEINKMLHPLGVTGIAVGDALGELDNKVALLSISLDTMTAVGIMTAKQADAIKAELLELYNQVKDAPDLDQVLSSHNWDKAVNNILTNWSGDIPELIRLLWTLPEAAGEAGDEVIKAADEVQDVMNRFDLDEAIAEYDKLVEKLGHTTAGTLDHINVISDMEKEYKALKQAEEAIVAQGREVDEELLLRISLYEKYVDIVEDAVPATETFSDALADLAISGAKTAKESLDMVVDAVGSAVSTFFDAVSAMKETNETALEDYKTSLQDFADAEGESVKDAADNRATALRNLSDDLEDDKITREQYGREKAQIEADYAQAVDEAATTRMNAGIEEEKAYRAEQVGIKDIIGDMLHDLVKGLREWLQLEAVKEGVLAAGNAILLNWTGAAQHAAAAVIYGVGATSLAVAGFAQGGMVNAPLGAPVMAVVHGGEEIRTPAQQMVDYEMMGRAVQAGTYEAMVEVLSKDSSRPIVVQLGDGTRLAQALYDPLQAELARRGG